MERYLDLYRGIIPHYCINHTITSGMSLHSKIRFWAQDQSQCIPLKMTCKRVFGQTFVNTTLFLISQINQQTTDAHVNKKDLKYLPLVGYQSFK